MLKVEIRDYKKSEAILTLLKYFSENLNILAHKLKYSATYTIKYYGEIKHYKNIN